MCAMSLSRQVLLMVLVSGVRSEEKMGFIVDNYCWNQAGHVGIDKTNLETNPELHILHCLWAEICVADGYAMLQKQGTKYEIAFQLDDNGDKLMKELAESEQKRAGDYRFDVEVKADGDVSDGGNEQTLAVKTLKIQPQEKNAAQLEFCYGECEADEVRVQTGYIVDNLCWGQTNHIAFDQANLETHPEKHSLACMLMDQCVESGYSMLQQVDSGKYEFKYKLDEAGNGYMVELLKEEKRRAGDRELNDQITAVGTVEADELKVEYLIIEPSPENVEKTMFCYGKCTGMTVSITGFIIDNLCWEQPNHIGFDKVNLATNPQDHTLDCLLNDNCVKSGYALLEKEIQGDSYEIKYQLNEAGNEIMEELLKAEKARVGEGKLDVEITAVGTYNVPTFNVEYLTMIPTRSNDDNTVFCFGNCPAALIPTTAAPAPPDSDNWSHALSLSACLAAIVVQIAFWVE